MRKTRLGDVLNAKRGMSLPGSNYAEEGNLVRLTLGNFDYPGGGFKQNTSKKNIYYVGEVASEFILNKGDVITPLTEQVAGLLGETARIPESDVYVQSGDIALLSPIEGKLDKSFMSYLVASPLVKKQLGAGAQQTKIRHTSPDAIEDCFVWIPGLSQQEKIGQLLDLLNNQIANDKKQIDVLERITRLIYDYWFTQFDFPDENGKPYRSSGGKMVWNDKLKREIPKGWRASRLNDLVSVVKGISYKSEDLLGSGIPMINLASFNTDGSYKPSGLKTYSGKRSALKTIKPMDLIMCVTQQTTIDSTGKTNVIGKALLVPDVFGNNDIVMSTDVAKLNCKMTDSFKYVLHGMFKRPEIHKYIIGYGNGTKIKHLDLNSAFELAVAVPPFDEDVLDKFASKIEPIERKKSALLNHISLLSSIQNWLFPLLMNGQARVG